MTSDVEAHDDGGMDYLQRLLLESLRRDTPLADAGRFSALSPQEWRDFLSLAAEQRVRPLLWRRIREQEVEGLLPPGVADALRGAYRSNTLRNLRLYAELRRLLSVLEGEGILLIPLKGIFLAESVYGDMGLREMSDVDLLARPADIARIVEILEGMGYVSLLPVPADISLQAQHHIPRMVREGWGAFEIHGRLTRPDEPFNIDPQELWRRAVPARVAGCSVLALAPEDLLLHLCLHTSHHHLFAFGLRPSCDIARVIDYSGPDLDWDHVVERAMRWGWQRGVYLALLLAKELVGAVVPETVLALLRPSDMSDDLRAEVLAQIFGDKRLSASLPPALAEFLESGGLFARARIFWRRLFLPRKMIASLYGVPSDSIRILVCYPRRLVDVLFRHVRTLRRYRHNDASLKSQAERTRCISCWLAGQG